MFLVLLSVPLLSCDVAALLSPPLGQVEQHEMALQQQMEQQRLRWKSEIVSSNSMLNAVSEWVGGWVGAGYGDRPHFCMDAVVGHPVSPIFP